MGISDKERDRRSAKKMHEQLDGIIANILNGPNAEEILTNWALNDPKGFSQLAASRMPKVQPVDQDLQKTYISLKAMLEKLPEVDDVHKIIKDLTKKVNKLTNEVLAKDEDIKFLQSKNSKLQKKLRA